MTLDDQIKEIRRLAQDLVDLTECPEPGIGTWHAMVGIKLQALAKLAPADSKGEGER